MLEETSTLQEDEISLIDVLIVLLKHKRALIGITLGAAALSAAICFLIPHTYKAETKILPPQENSSSIAAQLIGQISGTTGIQASSLGLKSPGDLYAGLLACRTIFDKVIDQFNLMDVYNRGIKKWFFTYHREDCLKDLADAINIDNGTDGIITLDVEDRDPHRAAGMANTFTDELLKLDRALSTTDAARRRLFYNDLLTNTKKNLADAEDVLKAYEEKTGALQIDEQAKAVIEGIAAIKAMIASKEVEVNVMRSYARASNPDLQKAEQELRELSEQMRRLEAKGGGNMGHDPLMPTERMPSVGTEYLRKVRDVKFNEVLFDLLAKQYESAKVDEAGQASVVQIVDRAIPPDKPDKPKTILIIIISTFAGFFVSVMIAFILEYKEKAQTNPKTKDRIQLLKRYAIFRRKEIR